MQGNVLSSLAFFAWIPIALWIASRWPRAKAATLLFLLPVMFLPERIGFKLTGLPEFDKGRIAIFWAVVAALIFHRQRLMGVALGTGLKLAIALIIVGGWITVFLNFDPIADGTVFRPGHEVDDVIHMTVINGFDIVLPFVLAVALFRSSNDLRTFLKVFVGAALVYSLLQLLEIRLSPQLHRWFYGFHPHHFSQTMRGGGFRPTVFMEHGLAVVMFTLSAIIAAGGLHRVNVKVGRFKALWVMLYLWVVLVLSKSTAAFLYSLVAVPLILFASPKLQFRAAVAMGILVFAYPMIRGAGLVPVDDIREIMAAQYGEQRAGSMMVRLVNEERLLERANERPNFGWGSYCRPCVFDPTTGKQMSISDGDWVITRGTFGRVGFLGKYLLLLLPLFLCARRMRNVRNPTDRQLLSTMALIVGFSAVDLVPNGNFNYLVFVFSGVLLGCTEGILRQQAHREALKRRRSASSLAPRPLPAGAH